MLQKEPAEKKLVLVGLGNPGKEYENTRHNVGFRIVKHVAKAYGASFRSALFRAKGSLAEASIERREVLLLLPLTYMNLSGLSVKRCLKSFNIPLSGCLVVVDDADLKFGELRLREKGSSGGHNGLKSMEAEFSTQEYYRLRVGVGRPSHGEDLADYVLSPFSEEEEEQMPEILSKGKTLLEEWIVRRG